MNYPEIKLYPWIFMGKMQLLFRCMYFSCRYIKTDSPNSCLFTKKKITNTRKTKCYWKVPKLYVLWQYYSDKKCIQLTLIGTQSTKTIYQSTLCNCVQLLHEVAVEWLCDLYNSWQMQAIFLHQILCSAAAETFKMFCQLSNKHPLDQTQILE